ncbi:MAG TPA: hypothetical protein VGG20_08460 [Thermoanaerobaculia bacterium]|jgi:hypothetical protein
MIQDLNGEQGKAFSENRVLEVLFSAPVKKSLAETPGPKSRAVTDEEATSLDRVLNELRIETGSFSPLSCVGLFERSHRLGNTHQGRFIVDGSALPVSERENSLKGDWPDLKEQTELGLALGAAGQVRQTFLPRLGTRGIKLLKQEIMGVDSHWLGPPGTTKRKLPSIEVVASGG